MPGGALLEEALFAEMILVAALSPHGKHIFVEAFAVFPETRDDFEVGDAVVHHLVDAPADFLWEAGDRAGATAGRAEREGTVCG
jgi:hypothetical protein